MVNFLLFCWRKHVTFSKIGNSALNIVHTTSWIFSLFPGSCPANWLQGNAKISNSAKKEIYINVLNHHSSEKLKVIGKSKFNHLINTLTLPLTFELKHFFNRWSLTRGIFNWNERQIKETWFELRISARISC
jgi:hypothetical protein